MSDDNREFLSHAERRRAEWLAEERRRRTNARTAEEMERHLANPDGDAVLPTDADDATNNFGNNQ